MRLARITACLFAVSLPARAFAGDVPSAQDEPMPTPIDRLGANVVDAFTGTNLFFYGGAIAATGLMAWGGADHSIRRWAQQDLRVKIYGDASYYFGYIAPVIVAPAVYL